MARKLTSKQIVLLKFPHAVCYRDKHGRFIVADSFALGGGNKESSAWIAAAKTARRVGGSSANG